MDNDYREEMLKLREELLLVEELDEILNEVIDNAKQSGI